jgi:beta-N-acetylhexosaminidase
MPDLSRQIARMFVVGFDGLTIPKEIDELISRGVRNIVLFKRNIQSASQLQQLCADLKRRADSPLAISIDHEGGRVVRLSSEFTQIPSARQIGQTNDPRLARQIGQIMGRELRAVNIDIDFAPVMDVDTNPANPVIGTRSFARNPVVVAQLGVALAQGLQSAGVAACAKHFPGHGDTSQDSHLTLPRLDHDLPRLNRIELPPFQAAVDAGIASIMTSHILFTAIDDHFPATMSEKILHGILRGNLRFDGVIFSDDLEMKAIAANFGIEEAVIRGVQAGIDLFLICHTPALQHEAIDHLINAVERGKISRAQIERSNERIDRLFAGYVKPANVSSDALSLIGSAEHRKIVERFLTTDKKGNAESDPTLH